MTGFLRGVVVVGYKHIFGGLRYLAPVLKLFGSNLRL
jgi:hypothetical protein